jgi:uncharacterized protein (AIM24 family)
VRSELFGRNLEASTPGEAFALQNPRMLRVALDGEVMARQGSMIAFQGQVEVFFANYAAEVHLLRLEGDVLSVNGRSILAFEPTLSWDIRRIEGASMFAGGLFNTVLEGTGWVAICAHGTPVVLQTDAPTYVDAQAAIAWSANLQTSIHRTMKVGALVGRGSGEAVQLAFAGAGFVIVQASEGEGVAPHNHGGGGGGGGLLDFG